MEVFQFNFVRLMTVFMKNCYLNCAKTYRSIATDSVSTKEHFRSALGIVIVLFEINSLCLLVPPQNVLPDGVYLHLSGYYVPMGIYDIFKLILSIQFIHFYLKYFINGHEWKSYKWLENFIIVLSNIVVFTIVLILSCIGLIMVPSTTFEKIIFVICLVVYNYISYFSYYTACIIDWFDKYIYSVCYTYTSTVNHNELTDRQNLIVSNLETRWHSKNVKKITQKETKIVQSAPQDLVNKGQNNIHSQFTSLNTSSQSLDDKDEYLISTRMVRPDSYYDETDTSAGGKSEQNEDPNKLCQYKLITM
ncbi:uncharacterized protein LOC132939876 [Metopolophium dirhodum]|uniref:uncharacterized protein LOC132939876 n=1 Tax=Metopolophium dirhodum TaxID=44670 RepID=UPI00298FD313|nr:uncharacterized protein LOC132939876 [Metopolophium dirhodum]